MSAANMLSEVPQVLKAIPNWVSWKLVRKEDGELSKVPYIVGTNFKRFASSTDSSTWTDFETAVANTAINNAQGVGFVIGGKAIEQNIIGVDIDGCRNAKTGFLAPWADQIIDGLNSYTEITPSQTGLRIWVIGKLPSDRKVFNLDPAVGFGGKVKIEVYDKARYFTVTGEALFGGPVDIESCDLIPAYKLFDELKRKHPAPSRTTAATSDAAMISSSVQVQKTGTAITDKFELLMHGVTSGDKPFIISDNFGNSVEYPDRSAADLAFCTLSAMRHGDNPDAIWADYEESSLYRSKWANREEDFRRLTIAKGIKSAAKTEVVPAPMPEVLTAPSIAADADNRAGTLAMVDEMSEAAIPAFDPAVINGIYGKIVELITRGTTLTPQFAFVIAKTIIGIRMAGKVTFENLDIEPRFYTALIGATGSGKGEAWRRALKILQPQGSQITCKIKVINSADSGAGLKDVFFEFPEDEPVLCYIDEIESLGNKSKETRNPAILDTMIELADSNSISRVLAKRSGGGHKSKHDARFAMVLCGQDGTVFTKAMAGRAKLGMYDRLYPEYGVPVEAGEIPPIDPIDAVKLLSEIDDLDYSGTMGLSNDAKWHLDDFWKRQPAEVRKKARFKKFLYLDAYMSAFGRGVRKVEQEDAVIAIKIFTRQLIIRRVCFSTEVPDRIGYYLGLLKNIHAHMVKQLKAGVPCDTVAKSQRDFETDTHAFRDNEGHFFAKAWQVFRPVHLMSWKVKKANGQSYEKWLPASEYWAQE
jgi:hypothetical protein